MQQPGNAAIFTKFVSQTLRDEESRRLLETKEKIVLNLGRLVLASFAALTVWAVSQLEFAKDTSMHTNVAFAVISLCIGCVLTGLLIPCSIALPSWYFYCGLLQLYGLASVPMIATQLLNIMGKPVWSGYILSGIATFLLLIVETIVWCLVCKSFNHGEDGITLQHAVCETEALRHHAQDLERRLDEALDRVRRAEAKLGLAETDLQNAAATQDGLDEEVNVLRARKKELEVDNSECKAKIELLKEEMNSLKKGRNDLEVCYYNCDKELQKLKDEIKSYKTKTSGEMKVLKEHIEVAAQKADLLKKRAALGTEQRQSTEQLQESQESQEMALFDLSISKALEHIAKIQKAQECS